MIASLVVSVAIVSSVAVFLALLMVIADATIANYGDVQIDVNEGTKDLTVKGGQPLLKALGDQGIFIPSACGGRGSCGLCKVQVVKGGGQVLPTELPWLNEQEQQDNVRLSCQFKVKEDISIKIPEELFLVKQYVTKVERLRDLTYDIKEVTLALVDPPEIKSKAGQYIQFQVPEYELTDEAVYRAYSISSAPSDSRRVELEIRLVPNGICTTYVHKYLKEGDEVIINGPYGDFFLSDTDAETICIAGGSGMAPIKAILLDMLDKGISRKTRYFFGARTEADLFLLDEMKELEQKLPDFTFIPALSNPEEGGSWKGETGLITDVVARYVDEGTAAESYLCGSPGMIDACIKVLISKGIPEEKIFYDKFS